MVYTVKKKKKKAEEMRVFLHEECVIFTKTVTNIQGSNVHNHHAYQHMANIQVSVNLFHMCLCCLQLISVTYLN